MSNLSNVFYNPVATDSPYPREELEEMMRRWIEANREGERTGDWTKVAGAMFTEDAEYTWNIGPNEEFVARGAKEIQELAYGVQMQGFQGWQYPYEKILIDEKAGELVGFWRQVSPYTREDGSVIEVAGTCGSWFKYGGDYRWSAQRDWFDLGNVLTIFAELAEQGHLPSSVKEKLHTLATGGTVPGHQKIRHAKTRPLAKVKQGLAMVKVALRGK